MLSRSLIAVLLLSGALPAMAAGADPAPAASAPASSELPDVVVTSTLQPTTVLQVPTSVTVLDSSVLEGASQQHFQDVLSQVPNLNWAGDTSRPRYFQIRGIGELEQYQGAPNPSVGFLIDDIDFSGLGSAATLYDVDQVEVLRGPQGTRYGANALAGLIYVKSKEPERAFDAGADVGVATYNTRSYGAYVTGAVGDDSAARLAVQRYTSDGFYHNLYLNRYDTNRRDENTLRARWRYQPSAALRVDLTVLRAQIDNGYDAYAIDNTRNTQSDSPSTDTQHSTGVAVKARYALTPDTALTAIATYAGSRVVYGYDSDWGNPRLWAQPQFGDVIYNYTDLQHRDRITRSAELRIGRDGDQAFHWIAGVYALQLHETLNDTSLGLYQYVPTDPTTATLTDTVVESGYRSLNGAVFGEVGNDLGPLWHWTAGARVERRTTAYDDLTTNPGVPDVANHFAPADNLWGGALTLNYRLQANETLYGALQRGYKAGGFNLSGGLLPGQLVFAPESDVNLELGYKAALLDHRLNLSSDVFYTRRHSLQAKTSVQNDPTNPNAFQLLTENVPHGYNEGVEAEARWRATQRWTLGAALGLLETQYSGLIQNGVVLPDRRLAHAAPWQAALNAQYRDPHGWFGRLDITGLGPFYFDLPPVPTSSGGYWLANLKAGYAFGAWSVSVWDHNAFNRNYAVRGFYFGQEPPNFPNKSYVQLGDPRVLGLDVSWRLGGAR